ncbi:hypothetical protein [Amycolatopsis sp. CA-128772]|uniref:hypothetical protein n=1 Tax=Amycolatopsis sp. CA-128772 TaxID=2073159 RepID=UPI000CD309BA|nr:hypothetical protein [Amycolatopsis sp. CA-128772]
MPNLRDVLRRKFRSVFSVLAAGATRPPVGDQLFARAHPERVTVTECHHYEQEISRNPAIGSVGAPTGRIEIVVPFDGADHFTRRACADVAPVLEAGGKDPRNAVIGHLAFAGHQHTDLGAVLGLDDSYGALPIEVPVTGPDAPGGRHELRRDRQAGVIRHEYRPRPNQLEVVPVNVRIDLLDPDTYGGTVTTQDSPDFARPSEQPNFRPYLWLRVRVTLIIPWPHDRPEPAPVVNRISLDWPTITSLHVLTVEQRGTNVTERPITYNPVDRTIEWRDVPMQVDEHHQRRDELRFVSDTMVVSIRQPGELYRQPSLDGTVELEIPDVLLSGMRTRLFDSLGRVAEEGHRECTRLTSRVHLILGEAFARRKLKPHQHLHFDEVIPEQARIADIENALSDRGFDVAFTEKPEQGGTRRWQGRAKRAEGPETMILFIFVEGSHHETERTVHKPGGHSYTSKLPSGELKVFMYGELPRASRAVTREMNALHAAVRDRFDRIRALR